MHKRIPLLNQKNAKVLDGWKMGACCTYREDARAKKTNGYIWLFNHGLMTHNFFSMVGPIVGCGHFVHSVIFSVCFFDMFFEGICYWMYIDDRYGTILTIFIIARMS